ncbi:alpha/beta-hydrolase [Dentipellis sp. KUC8613]|nr:alpha/beta-hydrolase [Dentipellis sp. KUC8613]
MTTYHPESWNSNANVFFIDQPDTTEEAVMDIAAFIVLFFEKFPAFTGRALHMAGESYGNVALVEAGITPINLISPIIGNGIRSCARMKKAEIIAPFDATGINAYDLSKHALLERGISVLVYVGDYDWICNWVGSERWTLALEWSGQKEFQSQALREWMARGICTSLFARVNFMPYLFRIHSRISGFSRRVRKAWLVFFDARCAPGNYVPKNQFLVLRIDERGILIHAYP